MTVLRTGPGALGALGARGPGGEFLPWRGAWLSFLRQAGGKEVMVHGSAGSRRRLAKTLHTHCRSEEVSCAVFPQPPTDLVGGIQRSTRAMSV